MKMFLTLCWAYLTTIVIASTVGLMSAEATGFRRVSSCGHSVFHQPVHHQVHHQAHIAPAAVYSPYPVYAVGHSYAQDNTGQILNALLIQEFLKGRQTNYQPTIQQQPQQYAPQAIRSPQGDGSVSQAALSHAYPQSVEPGIQLSGIALVKNKCARCHTGAGAEKGLTLFLDDGSVNVKLDPGKLGEIIGRIVTKDSKKIMPPLTVPAASQPSYAERLDMAAIFVGTPGQTAAAPASEYGPK